MKDRKKEGSETRELKITKHHGRPEYASYVQVSGLKLMSAAELYFSSEPEGMMVFRICDWLAAFTVNKMTELLNNYDEEEVGMMLQKMKKEPPIMSIGFLQGVLDAAFCDETADTLEILRLCESADDRVYDCFMERFWYFVKENKQLGFFFEKPEESKEVRGSVGKDDSYM